MQQLFINASAIAHEKLVNVLENKTGHGISTGNGVVTLDLHQLVTEIGTELGLPQDALAKLPNKAGTITLMKSDQLSAAQAGMQAVRVAQRLAAGRRARALRARDLPRARRAAVDAAQRRASAFALVGLLVLVLRRLLGNYITDALASPGYEPATHRLWLIGTSILGQIGGAAILYGAIAALGAILAGPSAPAVWLRQRLAPVLNERQGIVWGAVGFVFLLLVLWGGTHALRMWWGILLLGAPDRARRRRAAAPDPAGVPAGSGGRAGRGRRRRDRRARGRQEDRAHLEKGASAWNRHR